MLRQIFVDSDIGSLLNTVCTGKYAIKDKYLISQLAYTPLSLKEHNLLRLHQLIDDKGEVYRKWVLPAAYSPTRKIALSKCQKCFAKHWSNTLIGTNIKNYQRNTGTI
ncbi:hypothetical protein PPIS_a4228 [Pseudoalteromonas piscicida]|uniref:Uncharacterized protein n=1 Tax=Pseudoalteromonas piscicida TaxID=43662 RepID=A0ABM6NIZ2_PSEO7|nr:hypothetical protein PPIS_a4228 [Pseudoalteromonas piscicida]